MNKIKKKTKKMRVNPEDSKKFFWVLLVFVLIVGIWIGVQGANQGMLTLATSAQGLTNRDGAIKVRIRALDASKVNESLYTIDQTAVVKDGQLKLRWQIPGTAKKKAAYIEVCALDKRAGPSAAVKKACIEEAGDVGYNKVSCPYYVPANSTGFSGQLNGWNKLDDSQKIGCSGGRSFSKVSSVKALASAQSPGIEIDGGGVLVAKNGKIEAKDVEQFVKDALSGSDNTTVQVTTNVPVPGPQGQAGANGTNGADGAAGIATVSGGGLILTGQNLSLDDSCLGGQVLQWDGSTWGCASVVGTDSQTLSLAANVLAISGGNSVNLSGYLDNTDSQALSWVNGTRTLSLTGGGSVVISDSDTTYSAGNGLSLGGTTFSINSPTCAGTTKLTWNGTVFSCAADVDTDTDTTNFNVAAQGTVGSQNIASGDTVTFNNGTGTTATRSGGTVTYGLNNTAVTAASYAPADNANGSLALPQFTVDAQGRLTAASTTNVTLTGIANAQLANSAITVNTSGGLSGGSSVSLGGSVNLTIDLSDAADANTATTSSGSGLEVSGGEIGLIRGCATGELLKYNSTSRLWACATDTDTDTDTGVTSVGTIDSQTKSANGAVISGTVLYLQNADATNVGLVSTGTQTFAGDKTFNGNVIAGANLTVNGDVILGNAASDAITFTGEVRGASPLAFEGATNDGVYTTFAITDPTVARTITFPDASGTVCLQGSSSCAFISTTLADGQILIGNGSNVATAVTPTGDVTISNSGVTTIGANSVALTTDTTGNYVADVSSGTGISIAGSLGEGWTPTINLANTAVTAASYSPSDNANGSIAIPQFTVDAQGRLTAASTANITPTGIANAQLANSSLTVTAGGGLINGGAVSLGGATTLDIGAGSGITVNANDITIDLTVATDGLSATTSSSSGLEVLGTGLTLLQGCSDTQLLKWNETSDVWACDSDTDTGVTSIGTINSQTKSANGAVISGTSLVLQTADATAPGLVSTGTQTFAGNKTFTGNVTVNGDGLFQTTSDSATAFQVKDNLGTSILQIDTLNKLANVYADGGFAACTDSGGDCISLAPGIFQSIVDSSVFAHDGATSTFTFYDANTSYQMSFDGVGGALTVGVDGSGTNQALNVYGTGLINTQNPSGSSTAFQVTNVSDLSAFRISTASGSESVNVGANGLDTNFNVVKGSNVLFGVTATGTNGTVYTYPTNVDFQCATSATSCNFGSNSTAHTTNIGSANGTATTNLNGGTGGINIGTSAVAQTITIGNSTGATALTLNSGTGAINIGTNAIAHTVNIGTATGAGAVVVDCGTGNCQFAANATDHTTTLGSTTGTSNTNIRSGTAGIRLIAASTATGNVYIGNGTASTTPDLLVLDVKTDSGDPAGLAGAMYYNNNSGKFRCYQNGAWADCITTDTGVTSIGTMDSQTKSADGAVIVGSSLVMQTADATNPGLVSTGTQSFAGNKTFTGNVITNGSLQVDGNTILGDATTDTITAKGSMIANASATATTDTTSGTGTNTTTVTIAGTAFANGDVILIDNAGQDYYTRVTAGGGTSSLTVSPAVTFETGRTVTKYNIQNIGATDSDYTTQSNRFFQGYFLGGVVAGAGTTTLSDGRLHSTVGLNFDAPSYTFTNTADSTSAFRINKANGDNLVKFDTATTENLLTNGNFESSYSPWAGKSGSETVSQTGSQHYLGTGSMSVATTAAANDGVKYNYSLASQTTYTMTFYVKSNVLTAATSTINIGRSENGSTDSDCATSQTVNGGGWSKLTCTFTTGNVTGTDYIYLKQSDATARTLYIDAVELQSSGNLNTNPDVEVDTSGWSTYSSPTLSQTTSQAYTGSGSLQVDTSLTGGYEGPIITPTTQPNTTYTASFWVQLDSATSGSKTVQLYKRFDSTDGTSTSCTSATLSPGVWTNLTCTFTTGNVTAGSPYIGPVMIDDTVTPITFYVDNASVSVAKWNSNDIGRISLNGAIDSPLTVRGAQDSTSALQVQQQNGSNVLTVDTLNSRVGIGTAAPTKTLEVNGKVVFRPTSTDTDSFQVTNTATIGAANSVIFNVAGSSRIVSAGLSTNTSNVSLNVYGTSLVKTMTSGGSASAFSVQDSANANVLTVSTSSGNKLVYVGEGGIDSKFQIVNTSSSAVLDIGTTGGGYLESYFDDFRLFGSGGGLIFTSDGVANTINIGDADDSSAAATTLFVVDSASTANLPIGIDGGIVYDTSTSKFKIYEGGAYKTLCNTTDLGCAVSTSIGTIDSQTKSANGAVISGNSLVMQNADTSFPGLVSTGTQTFGGNKTFNNDVEIFGSSINLGNNAADTITATANLRASNFATGTTDTTNGTGTNTTTLTIAGTAFSNNDVILIDNAGQDYYTRVVSGGGTSTLTVSPAISFDNGVTVTKYTIQNIGATPTDYTTQSNRFFQGYFLGGVVTGSGSTTLSDGLVSSTGGTLNLYGGGADGASAVGLIVNTPSYSTSGAKLVAFQNNGTEKFSVDKDGNINIVTGAAYKINGSDICTSSGCAVLATSGIQNQSGSDQTGDFRISGIGRANTSLQTPLLDTATATALDIGTTNATGINLNQNTTVAAGKNFNAYGRSIFKSSTGLDSAFQVQNTSGDLLLNIGNAGYSSADTNLITNSNFENGGSVSWNNKNGGGVGGGGTNGAYSGSWWMTSYNTGVDDGTKYDVTLSPSTTYTFSAYVRLPSGSMSTLVLGHQDQSGTDIDCAASPSFADTDGWVRVSCIFTTGGTISNSNVYIKQSDASTRTIYIDAAMLQARGYLSAYTMGDNFFAAPLTRGLIISGATSNQKALDVQSNYGTSLFNVDSSTNVIGAGTTMNFLAPNYIFKNTSDSSYAFQVQDQSNNAVLNVNTSNNRIEFANYNTSGGLAQSSVADGASAIGFNFNTTSNYTTSGAKLLSISNWGVEKFYIDKDGGLSAAGGLNIEGDTTLGNAATDALTITSEIRGASPLVFEGTTNDDVYTTFAITDPTSARTITFPNATGTVILDSTLASTAFVQNGNSFSASAVIGTNDTNALIFETDSTARGRFTSTGELLINTATNTLNSQVVINSTAGKDTGLNILGDVNSFYQLNIQNANSGSSASSDFVATANNGTATTYYVDFGINGSAGGAAPFTGANDAYLYASDSNNLHIGALGSSGALKFYTTGGTSSPVQRLSINASGQASFDAVNSSGTGYTFNANSVTTGTALQVNATSLTSGLAFQVVGPSSKNLLRIKNDTTLPLDDQSVIIGEGGISASKPDSLARDQLYVFGRINYSWNMFTQDFLSGNPAVAADGLFMNGYYDENIGTGGTSPSGQIQMQSTAGSSGMARLTFTGTLGTGPWASNWGTGGNLVTERSLNPVFEARVQASSNTDVRHIVGFTDMALNATTSADTNNSANEVLFRKTAAGTNWEAVSRNGSGTEEVTTLATACAGSTACTTTALRTMRIELENVGANGTARFYIDGTLVATHTTTAVPANTNRLGWLLTNTPTTTTYSGRNLDMDYVRVWSDDPPSSIAPGDVGQNEGIEGNTNSTENVDTPTPEDNSNEALLGRIKTLEEDVSDLKQYKDVLTTESIGESSLKKAIFIADVEFRKQVEFSADALFKANVNVDGTLNANGRVVVSNNTGTITIQPGQNEIQVLFAKSLVGKPNVFLSTENPDVKVVAQARTKDGFVIKLSEPIAEPLDVQWLAVERE